MINKILLNILIRKLKAGELKLEDVKNKEYRIEAEKY